MQPDYPSAVWRAAATGNYDSRPAGVIIDCVVLHATVGSLSATLGWFANPDSGVSAHYVVAKNGRVYQMVEEDKLAHHAGASQYQGRQAFNDFSIGIEIVNKNDGLDPYPPDQFEAIVGLVAYLVERYDIAQKWIVTHAEISTVGKTDPRDFPMRELTTRIFDPAAHLPENLVREAAWNAAGIPFNPLAAFPKYARERDLGTPMTQEFDFSYQGVSFRGQGFSRGIVFCKVGDWGNLKEMTW
jgi:N-acetyl-anhydromuramyl-L-alanine amidase AmpD